MSIHVSSSGIVHGGTGGTFGNVPPVGTSAHKAFQAAITADRFAQSNPWSFSPTSSSGSPLYGSVLGNTNFAGSSLDKNLTSALGTAKSSSGSGRSVPTTAYSGPSAAVPSAQSLDYLNADLATYYGMSPETAYQEALSNTAYQRAVKDMQAAGLNPAVLFGAGRASTADGVYRVSSLAPSSSGGSGRSGRSYSSGGSGKYLFSSGAYGVISAAAGLVGMATLRGNPTGYWIGSQTAKGIMSGLNSLFK